MERKSSKEYCLLVEGQKFKLRNLPSRTSSLLSVLLRTRSAQSFSSQHLVAVPTPNLAELVPSVFFLSTTIVFATVPTHFARTYSSFGPFKNVFFGPKYGRFSLKVTQFCLRTNTKLAYLKNERKMKRTREGSSQTGEDEIFEDDSHDCQKCKLTNSHLIEIDEKLNRP